MKKLFVLLAMSMTLVVTSACGNEGVSDFQSDSTIHVVSREDGSGTRGAFVELFGIEEETTDGSKDLTTEEATIANKTDIMMTNVAQDLYSIGYVSMGSVNDDIKALQIDGIEPTTENVKNGTYKVSRPFNIATKGEATGLTKDFIDYILSSEGQEIVSDGYIAVDEDTSAYTGDKPSGEITVAGSSSVAPIMEKLIEGYAEVNSNATIELQISDSTSGMTGTIDGTCDIGMASRDLKDSELEELQPTEIALDGIAVIVNKDNPVEELTSDEVGGIYKGYVTTWEGLDE